MKTKNILITGITGQDGAYLARELISEGFHVYGVSRGITTHNRWRLEELDLPSNKNITLVEADLTMYKNCHELIEKIQPQQIYNLGGLSSVSLSINNPLETFNSIALITLNLLESIKNLKLTSKFYQASSSEMFGKPLETPQNEYTQFSPLTPYATSKVFAHHLTLNYLNQYDIFTSRGILYNHESPLRDLNFVSRKITNCVARIKLGLSSKLILGNIHSVRDWGFAKDYVQGMRLIVEHKHPDTFILSSFNSITVKSFVETSFDCIGVNLIWDGDGVNTKGYDSISNELLVETDKHYYRPTEFGIKGDYSKAHNELGWQPKTSIEQLCSMMVEADILKLRKNIL